VTLPQLLPQPLPLPPFTMPAICGGSVRVCGGVLSSTHSYFWQSRAKKNPQGKKKQLLRFLALPFANEKRQ